LGLFFEKKQELYHLLSEKKRITNYVTNLGLANNAGQTGEADTAAKQKNAH
jgi:hypothetical protein